MSDNFDMPGHLARRFQQIAVSLFHAEIDRLGLDLTPVQYAALTSVAANPDIDQITLGGLIAQDRTTITGVVDRLVRKQLLERLVSERDRRARMLRITPAGIAMLDHARPAVHAAQRMLMGGLSEQEAHTLLALLRKAVTAANSHSRAPLKSRLPDEA